ncbi:MAG: hypothetical protein Q8933_11075 [Bacteroidota bacterium]|nr:hypothetical protein [Bacteroidota bacterium]
MLFKYKPAVPKFWLFGIAGLMWSLVGLMLIRLASQWIALLDLSDEVIFTSISVLTASIVYRFGFLRLAQKNINRLAKLPEKPCIFAFQAWKSYLIIVFMIALGITLRHSPIPKKYLSVVYITIGGGLFLSSIHYYFSLCKLRKNTA